MSTAQAKRNVVERALRTLVSDLSSGDALPTERALAERWGVARMTVRSAIAVLVREGRLRAEQGRGTFVQPQPISLRVRLGSFADELHRAHLVPETRTLGVARDGSPPREVQRHFRLGVGTSAVRLERLRLGDGTPLALERAWLPVRIGRDLLHSEAPTSLYSWLDERGLLPDAGEESVTAGLPDRSESHHLGIAATTPVIRLRRRSTCQGRPVEYAEAVLPASRYELWFSLRAGDHGRLELSGGSS